MQTRDGLLSARAQKLVFEFLNKPGWEWDWKSNRSRDMFSFAHKHFAGNRKVEVEPAYDCADELRKRAPLMFELWQHLSRSFLKGHRITRCYANGMPYGTDGTIHYDDKNPRCFTTIYYPHETWSPNWGGETLFLNNAETDVIKCVYPKPNRLLTFNGTIKHRASGVSRTCPVMRITLMFKTDTLNGSPNS